jgi:Protein of unknown function (DUF1579)
MKAIRRVYLLTLAGALVACTAANAADSKQPAMSKEQQAMMASMQKAAEVRPEHKQLDYFVGDWATTTTMASDGKSPPQKSEGKAHSEAIFGGRYLRMTFDGTFQDQPFKGEGFFGFDNMKGKFLNTWIDSMSTSFWLAYGTYDAASKTYTFRGDMADYTKPGAQMAVRQTVHIVDPTHYTFEWYEMHGGKEAKMMTIDYTKH